MVEAHYFDGESVFKIQRKRGMKRRDVEGAIAAALETMRTILLRFASGTHQTCIGEV